MDTVRLHSTKIVLVGGDRTGHHTLKAALRRRGFRHILSVATARDAIEQLAAVRVDLLVTWVGLPDVDAWRLIRMVRSGRFCRGGLPIVVVCEGPPRPVLEAMAKDHDVPVVSIDDESRLLETLTVALSGLAKPTLLVVEDDARVATLIHDSLQHRFDAEIAYNGQAGLEAWKRGHHDLVILDIVLPRMSGPDVLHEIMKADGTQPVIILTAHATPERHQDLILAGAVDFLAKPFQVEQLRQTCESVLRYREFMRTHAQFEEAASVAHQISNRVYAADRCLSVGRAWVASEHLKTALALCRHAPPTDEEWARLVREFTQ